MEQPLVSIIIPTYNYAHLIDQTLTCLLQQSYNNWEAIIIDDGSTDNTKVVVRNFSRDSRFVYYFQENSGLPAARNTGINIAKGKYIQFLDADDLISKEKLSKQVSYMESHPGIHISYTNALYFRYDNVNVTYGNRRLSQTPWIPKLHGKGINIIRNLVQRNMMPVNAALIKHDVFNIVGLQNESLKSLEDWEFWIRCALADLFFSYFEHLEAFALVRLHANSMSLNKIRMRDQELIFRDQIDLFINNNLLLERLQKEELKSLNEERKINTYRKLFLATGFFNKQNITEVYSKYGLYTLAKIYFKALNDFRKQRGNF